MWIAIAILSIFAVMFAACILADMCKDRPFCYRTNPDPMRRGMLGCEGCSHRGGCLK